MPAGNYFFALYPPPEVRAALAGTARDASRDGRPVKRSHLHMTLAFLGERDAAGVAAAELAAQGLAVPPFTLRLDRLGYFYRQRLLWLGAHSVPPALTQLAGLLRERLLSALADSRGRPDRLVSRAPPFVPHVTLGRRVAPHDLPEVEPICWGVDRFFLMQSVRGDDAHSYRLLGEWLLADG